VLLSLGGITVGIDPADAPRLPSRLEPWIVPERNDPAVAYTGRHGPVEDAGVLDAVFDSGGVWRVDRRGDGIRISCRCGGPSGSVYQALELGPDLSSGRATLDAAAIGERDPFLLRAPMLELWMSFLLMRGRGLLVHGLGVLAGGRVHVFAGPSGAGKTTMARVFASLGRHLVLSDDRLILRTDGERLLVHGTPWHGESEHASPEGGELAALWLLEKAPESSALPLAPDRAARGLAGACFAAGWPRTGWAHVLGACARVAREIPCGTLRFAPDESAVRAAGLD